MSNLTTEKKTVERLLTDRNAQFLIPDYQRPYAWGEEECETLWEDIFAFAFPNNNGNAFDDDDEYFLGSIVTFKNEDNQSEVIDGQQRLITIVLLLRAVYDRFDGREDQEYTTLHSTIGQCIWKTDRHYQPIKNQLKIDSEVASDDDREEFLKILVNGEADSSWKSAYANNFRLFNKKIEEYLESFPDFLYDFFFRLLNNVILLPIEVVSQNATESQDMALRIFSTLNDRGMPLSDADIFKSQFYKFYSGRGEKDRFIKQWKDLEEITAGIFHPRKGTPMDELFTRYMYYLRARAGDKSTTTPGLRDFYSRDNYSAFKDENTLSDLKSLANFWERVNLAEVNSNDEFSMNVRRQLYILSFAPNSMWTYLVSVYFLANRDSDDNDNLNDEQFCQFLRLIIGFLYAYAIYRPGVSYVRPPVLKEMTFIAKRQEATFSDSRFNRAEISECLRSFEFTNGRAVTKSILVWWAFFSEPNQEVLNPDAKIEIEHIYARKRNEMQPLEDPSLVEALGNKAILESRINSSASNNRFEDKKRYYLGQVGKKEPTFNKELVELAKTKDDFTEEDIVERTNLIIDSFVDYLGDLGLLQD